MDKKTLIDNDFTDAANMLGCEVAGQSVVVLSDGRVTINEAIALAQIIYGEIKK